MCFPKSGLCLPLVLLLLAAPLGHAQGQTPSIDQRPTPANTQGQPLTKAQKKAKKAQEKADKAQEEANRPEERSTASAQGQTSCDRRLDSSFDYPVIAYDASTRTAQLRYRSEVKDLKPNSPNDRIDIPSKGHEPEFLCYGRPVEVYVFNRRLKANFSVTVTTAISAENAEITGYTAPSAAPAAASPSTTPAAKGLQPIATGANLLTTDQVINDFLNEETFDRALNRVQDDAASVLAQARQFQANYDQYLETLHQLIGPRRADRGMAVGSESLSDATVEFGRLSDQIRRSGGLSVADEKTFDDWTEAADRLETDTTRISVKLQNYPVADTLINLRASASTLVDNIRGVVAEYRSLRLAREILLNLMRQSVTSPKGLDTNDKLCSYQKPIRFEQPNYIDERARAELRIQLRAQYPGTSIDEPTLARILELHRSLTEELSLRTRLCPVGGNQPPEDDWANSENVWRGKISDALRSRYVRAGSLCGNSDCLAKIQDPNDVRRSLLEPIDLTEGLSVASGELERLRREIKRLNEAEALAFDIINDIYNRSHAVPQVLTLDLSNYGKNLYVYYTVSGFEEFHRYRILNEVPQPQSNCLLSIAANVNASGGQNPCTTATGAIALPAASASTASSAPGTSAPPATPSTGGSTANTPAAAAQPGPPPDFYGHFELHNFSKAALFTGVAYDSVPNVNFNWVACPTSATNTTGSTATNACISPTTAAGATTPQLTYYQLVKTRQPQIAAIEGIAIYPWKPRDMFREIRGQRVSFSPELFIGAAAYPLDHYFLGGNVEPIHGMSFFGGLAFGAETTLPRNSPYQIGSVAQGTAPPALTTSTSMHTGVFVGVAFHTSLFGSIFNGSVFQNVLSIGTAGSSKPSSTPSSGSQ